MIYTLIKIKTFLGREGHGLNATICRDGVPVAFVLDEANGGPYSFDFRNPGQNPASFRATTTEQARDEESRFTSFARAWYKESGREAQFEREMQAMGAPERTALDPEVDERLTTSTAMESWVGAMVDAHEEQKMLTRHAKTKTLFRLKGDEAGNWRTLKAPTNPETIAYIRKKYGERVETIYGEVKS